MNMKMNVSTTIFIPSKLASAVFPLDFVFLISLPPLSFTAKKKAPFYTQSILRSRFVVVLKTQLERSIVLKLVLSLQFP